jgi:crossover junction endodeoxyribonuclease RuvC
MQDMHGDALQGILPAAQRKAGGMKRIISIDPGVTGAVCVLDPDGNIEFYDTPTVKVKSGKTFKNMLDPMAITILLQSLALDRDVTLTIEKVNAMPGRGKNGELQTIGATSAFNFGMGFGIWIGVISALYIPFQQVHPRTWKKLVMFGMDKEKDASRIKAMQLYPKTAKDLNLKKHHGRADALLIAEWTRRTLSADIREVA